MITKSTQRLVRGFDRSPKMSKELQLHFEAATFKLQTFRCLNIVIRTERT